MKINKYIISGLKDNLQNGTFTIDEVAIYSANYLRKGQISENDYDDLMAHLKKLGYEPTSTPVQPTLEELVTLEQQVAELQNQLDELKSKL